MRQNAIIPAQPGWQVLEPVWDGDVVVDLIRHTVIAWEIELGDEEEGTHPYPIPVCAEILDDDLTWRDPNGRVFTPYAQEFTDDAGVKRAYEAARAAKLKRKASQ